MELDHFVDHTQTKAEQDEILRTSGKVKNLFGCEKGREYLGNCLRGKKIIVMFMQPSTRTRLKCELAGESLGAIVKPLDEIAKTSMVKGESWYNSLLTFSEDEIDILAIRQPRNYLPQELAAICKENHFRPKIINLGDGNHLHPTQGLGDIFTIKEHFTGRFDQEPLKIAVGADMKARALHSLVMVLAKYPVELTLVSWQEPGFLMPREYLEEFTRNNGQPREVAKLPQEGKFDVIYWIRYQIEHAPEGQREELQEKYNKDFRVSPKFMNTFLKENGILLHPGPMTEEIDIRINSDPRMKYGEQLRNNRFVMMALYIMMLKPDFYVPEPSEI